MRELEVAGLAAADGLVGPSPVPSGEAAEGVKHAAAHTECLNCGAELHGPFCSACGQVADDHHRSILHLAWEAVEGLTHLDGRLANTLPALFFAPGKLARDHFEGRRQRHVPPFRLFLVTLLVFMFSLEAVFHHADFGGRHVPKAGQPITATDEHGRKVRMRMPTGAQLAAMSQGRMNDAEIRQTLSRPADADEAAAVTAPAKGTGDGSAPPALKWLMERIEKIQADPELFKTLAFQWGHRLAILLLPIFAALLTLCYCYRRQFYVYDHLVVAMQYLSFVFLLWGVAYLTPGPLRGLVMLAAVIWTPANLYMTLRGAYGSGRIGAGIKALGLWVATQALFLLMLVGVLGVAAGQL